MIKKLSIDNYILIDHLEMDIDSGFNIVTGETGAGKSILMGALELLTGERADTKSLNHQESKCVIEGWFDIDNTLFETIFTEADIEPDAQTIIRREILPTGKSRAFVNDTPVTLDVLKRIGSLLIDVHGQQDTLQIAGAEKQTETFDILAETRSAKQNFQHAFTAWQTAGRELKKQEEKRDKENAELSYKQFVFNELEQAGLKSGEQEELEKQLDLLKNAEDIKIRLNQTLDVLDGNSDILSGLKTATSNLEKLASFSENLGNLANRTKVIWLEMKDITEEVRSEESQIHHDQNRIVAVDERLSVLYSLQKKHRKETENDLIAFRDELSGQLEGFAHLDEEIENLKARRAEMETEMMAKGSILSQLRRSKSETVSKKLLVLIADMGMEKARFEVEISEAQPSFSGLDKIAFRFSANPGLPLADLKNTASGGEFSRLMLAFKCLLAETQSMPTLIFDEIDTGISGEVAAKVGKIMKQLSGKHQVISITHSAQLASQADAHWFVYKKQEINSTFTGVKRLSDSEKLEEIAKMISGSKVSGAALEAAKELIAG